MRRITPDRIYRLKKNEIFVFGSNLNGIHGDGSASQARSFGAQDGIGEGRQGQTYAIPTRIYFPGTGFRTLSVSTIGQKVSEFLDHVYRSPEELQWWVVPIGCGNAGLKPKDIAPMFADAVEMNNVALPQAFWDILNKRDLFE